MGKRLAKISGRIDQEDGRRISDQERGRTLFLGQVVVVAECEHDLEQCAAGLPVRDLQPTDRLFLVGREEPTPSGRPPIERLLGGLF